MGWSTVNIPDLNFKAALVGNDAIDNNPADDEIQYDEATAYTGEIIVNGLSIANLTGIEAFTKITSLNCSNNSLTSLNVSSNTALTALYCNDNHLRILNVKNGNNSNFTDFDATSNPDLTCIQIDGGIVNYSASPWTNKDAGASYNEVCTVNIPDANFKAVLVADLSINTYDDGEISYDEATAYAGGITVSSLGIEHLTGIEAFTNITYLDCSYNSLTSLDVSSNTALEYLYCNNNLLTSLDVSSNTALQYLYCYTNLLTTLNVKNGNNASIYDFDATSNPDLSCIQVDDVDYMNSNFSDYIDGMEGFSEDCSCVVNIPDDNFRSYLLSSTINLNSDGIIDCGEASAYTGSIDVNSMGISDLTGIEAFTALTELYCSDNSLTTLDVSSNTALEYLDCSYNTLTGLNVQNGNNYFSSFNATNNPDLTCIQVDDADYMNSTFSGGIDGLESFSTNCGANLIWTGNTDTDWNTVSNWNMGFVPSGSNNITIPDVTNNPVATNVTVGSGKVLTINPAGELTVSGILTNSGTVIIQSDAASTGSLITNEADGAGIGIAFAECYMTTGAWHQVSPPLALQTVADFLTAEGNVTNIATKNTTDRAMMNYNPSDNTWSAFYTNGSAGTFAAGQGYMMRTDANAAVIFAGTLTTGSTEVTLSGAGDTGWNLIGNPYTSAIDLNSNTASDFLTANPAGSILDESSLGVYVWNQVSEIYDPINWATDPDVAVLGQAFFVKSYSEGVGVTFNSGMQLHSSTGLKSAKSAYPEIKLIAANDGTKAATTIKFISGTTKGLDPGYDAGLFSLGSTVSLYTKLVEDNGVNFMLQCLPANDYSSMIIPIGINSKAGGQVVFSAEAINLSADCKIILEDKISKTFTDLSKNDYTTTIAANSSIPDRFRLHTSYQTTGLDVAGTIAGRLSAYAIRNTEILVNGKVSKQAIATLYDIQGRVVLIKNLEEGILNVIETSNLRTGIYLLSVKDNNRVQVFKIPVRE